MLASVGIGPTVDGNAVFTRPLTDDRHLRIGCRTVVPPANLNDRPRGGGYLCGDALKLHGRRFLIGGHSKPAEADDSRLSSDAVVCVGINTVPLLQTLVGKRAIVRELDSSHGQGSLSVLPRTKRLIPRTILAQDVGVEAAMPIPAELAHGQQCPGLHRAPR